MLLCRPYTEAAPLKLVASTLTSSQNYANHSLGGKSGIQPKTHKLS